MATIHVRFQEHVVSGTTGQVMAPPYWRSIRSMSLQQIQNYTSRSLQFPSIHFLIPRISCSVVASLNRSASSCTSSRECPSRREKAVYLSPKWKALETRDSENCKDLSKVIASVAITSTELGADEDGGSICAPSCDSRKDRSMLAAWKPPYLWRAISAVIIAGQFVQECGLTGSKGVLALDLARELSLIVTAILLAGRVGSALVAELGTMQVSGQLDRWQVLRTNPVDYLVNPRRGSVQRKRVVWAQAVGNHGHGRFHDKELHMRHFEYHAGGKVRPARPTPADTSEVLLFQGFNWESPKQYPWWLNFQSKVEDLAELGVTDVWLPPVSQSVDKNGYLPGQLYNLDASRFGKGTQLRDLIDTLHTHGICAVADIVINHRSGNKQDSAGHWNVFEGGVKDKRLAWGPWAVVDDDTYDSGGKGHHDTGEKYGAAPDLDHTNKQVQDELTDWMNWLRAEIGFDGWRFDFAKGFAPKYSGLYCERTSPTFAVGEVWTTMSYTGTNPDANQDPHRQKLCDWIDGTGGRCCAFDFTTKGVLQAAVQGELWRLQDANGKAPGLIGWWPQRAVTFLDNHDTGSTQRHWNFPDDKVAMGYAYIITHPGIPCIFYDHYFEWKIKGQIRELVEVRRRNFITSESKLSIHIAEDDIYVATVADRLIVKLGPRMEMGALLPDEREWKLATYGDGYAVWESSRPPTSRVLPEHDESQEDNLGVVAIEPTHTVHVTEKMSHKTKKRILEEVPELVDKTERDKYGHEAKD